MQVGFFCGSQVSPTQIRIFCWVIPLAAWVRTAAATCCPKVAGEGLSQCQSSGAT